MTGLTALQRAAPPTGMPPPVAERLAKAERMIDLGWAVAALWGVLRLVAVLWLGRTSGGYEALWFVGGIL